VCICQRQNQKETFKNESPRCRSRPSGHSRCLHCSRSIHSVHCAAVGPRRGAGQKGGKGMVMVTGVVVPRRVRYAGRYTGGGVLPRADSEQEKYENEKNRHCQTTARRGATGVEGR